MTHTIAKSAVDQIPGFAVRVASHAKEMRDWRAQMRLAAEHKDNPNIAMIDRYVERPRPAEHPLVEAAVNEADEADFDVADDGPTPEQALASKKVALVRMVANAEAAMIEALVPSAKLRFIELRRSEIFASDVAIVDGQLRTVDAERAKLIDLASRHAAAAASANECASRVVFLDEAIKAAGQQIDSIRDLGKPGVIAGLVEMVAGSGDRKKITDAAVSALGQVVAGHEADLAKSRKMVQEHEATIDGLKQEMRDQDAVVKAAHAEWSDRGSLLASKRAAEDHRFMLNYEARDASIRAIQKWAAKAMHDVADLTVSNVDSWSMPPPPAAEH